MCGLSGIFSKENLNAEVIISSMKSILHRGPDDTQVAAFNNHFSIYSTEFSSAQSKTTHQTKKASSNNWIGFNRLSIVDTSFAGMQPFYDETRQVAFMMVGEIYNYRELRKEFLSDRKFISNSDAEVAFRLYLLLGDDFVRKLEGMFSMVIVDYKNNTLKILRDVFGQKTCYYTISNGLFIFSSEIKGIFATGLVKKEIEPRHLAYSLYLGTCPNPLTIYKNISAVNPGCCLTLNLNDFTASEDSFIQLSYTEDNREISSEEFGDDIHAAVKKQLTGEVKKGLMLSGGLDSGLLGYHLGKLDTGIQAFSLYTADTGIDEAEVARITAKKFNLPFEKIIVPHRLSRALMEEFMAYEEDPNEIPEPAYFLSKHTRSLGVKVLYNATALDELFGGYGYYGKIQKYKRLKNMSLLGHFSSLNGKLSKFHRLNEFGLEYLPTMIREKQDWNEILKLFTDEGKAAWEHPFSFILSRIKKQFSDFGALPVLKRISYWDIYYYISSHHSHRNDLAGMKNSTEIRFPFLDFHFVQKYFNFPGVFSGIERENKPFIRKYAEQMLPKEALNMKKKGFTIAVNSIQDEAQKIIAAQPQYKHSGIFNMAYLDRSIRKKGYKLQWELASMSKLF